MAEDFLVEAVGGLYRELYGEVVSTATGCDGEVEVAGGETRRAVCWLQRATGIQVRAIGAGSQDVENDVAATPDEVSACCRFSTTIPLLYSELS